MKVFSYYKEYNKIILITIYYIIIYVHNENYENGKLMRLSDDPT